MGLGQKTSFQSKVAIVGARGYSGIELARLLLDHPHAALTHCFATKNDWKISDFIDHSLADSVAISSMNEIEKIAPTLDTVFLATPAEVSMELAQGFLKMGVNVIDLSGAFRLPLETFEKAYGMKHTATALLSEADFGILPWAGPLRRSKPQLIANPGCYATSVFMALIPLLAKGAIREETLVIDSKSGASGGGKKAAENLLFTEVEGECLPYKVGKHQHLPEIIHHVRALTGTTIDPMFTTHLLPVNRGIISGIYARLAFSFGTGPDAQTKIAALFQEAYSSYPLVTSGPVSPRMMSLKRVVGTARSSISFSVEGDKLYVFSTLDNLMKGAASQAVENFNRLLDLPLASGLISTKGNT
jgi:N-acetyl-gamma-glutamyl-phosphate reductase